jgi:hypothetical protein
VATPDRIGSRDGIVTFPLPHTLTVGPAVRERWNAGVFGPELAYNPAPDERGAYFSRLGDQLRVVVGMFGDRNGEVEGEFVSPDGTIPLGSTQLLRNGEAIHEGGGQFPVPVTLPAEAATYTVRHSVSKPGPLSTRVDAEWTFWSAHVSGDTPEPVPALVVRFALRSPSMNWPGRSPREAGPRLVPLPVLLLSYRVVGVVVVVAVVVVGRGGGEWSPPPAVSATTIAAASARPEAATPMN